MYNTWVAGLLDLKNVTGFLRQTGFENVTFLNKLDLGMLSAFLDEPDLRILPDSRLEMLQFSLFFLILT
ncbi:hypothetical protein RclHR1_11900014 [Rhizophagus clarus]|uniref:Uncharacterized protein n=1 Tax=Rhizophagus clarus TaxID=94130 RepID=A0A2Z6QKR8_9GLOM|nr:hypothetical protein RclHR1_11900014 [Rhizophagus clarus]